jgi:hypothetical protein
MADMLLPARIGDILRAALIARKEKISRVASLATIVIERVYDVLTILLVLLFVVLFFKLPEPKSGAMSGIRAAGVIATGLCLGIISVLLILKTRKLTIIHIFEGPFAFLPAKLRMKLSAALDSFTLGLQSIQWSWHLAVIVLYSILLWTAFAFSNFFVLRALGFGCDPAIAYFILLFQVLGVTLPSSPGFIGTYHAAVVAGLSIFSMSFEDALSTAILMHASFFFPFIVCGLLFLWKENISLSDIRSVNGEAPYDTIHHES